MKRRTFLRTATLGATALGFPHLLRAKEKATPPPHAEKLPVVPFGGPAGSWTLVVLPDTQNMVASYPEVFDRQCECRRAILLTHCYLYFDSQRYDWAKFGAAQKWDPKANPTLVADGGVNDGQNIWDKIIAPSKNVALTLNGHVLNNGTGHLATAAADGHTVHQILVNYQADVQVDDGTGTAVSLDANGKPERYARPFGGGFLRLMRFHPDGRKVSIKSYSPWYHRFLTQADQQFEIAFA